VFFVTLLGCQRPLRDDGQTTRWSCRYEGHGDYFNSPALRYNGSRLSFPDGGGRAHGYGDCDTFLFRAELISAPLVHSSDQAQVR
jgi:hypothetical protein